MRDLPQTLPLEIITIRTATIQQITPNLQRSTSKRSSHQSVLRWANHMSQNDGIGEKSKGAVECSPELPAGQGVRGVNTAVSWLF